MLVGPDDPLLLEVAAAQAADPTLSALIQHVLRRAGEESNPVLPIGSPSGSSWGQYVVWGGLLYNQGKLCIPPTSAVLILKLLQQYHDCPLAGHYGVARTQTLLAQ